MRHGLQGLGRKAQLLTAGLSRQGQKRAAEPCVVFGIRVSVGEGKDPSAPGCGDIHGRGKQQHVDNDDGIARRKQRPEAPESPAKSYKWLKLAHASRSTCSRHSPPREAAMSGAVDYPPSLMQSSTAFVPVPALRCGLSCFGRAVNDVLSPLSTNSGTSGPYRPNRPEMPRGSAR